MTAFDPSSTRHSIDPTDYAQLSQLYTAMQSQEQPSPLSALPQNKQEEYNRTLQSISLTTRIRLKRIVREQQKQEGNSSFSLSKYISRVNCDLRLPIQTLTSQILNEIGSTQKKYRGWLEFSAQRKCDRCHASDTMPFLLNQLDRYLKVASPYTNLAFLLINYSSTPNEQLMPIVNALPAAIREKIYRNICNLKGKPYNPCDVPLHFLDPSLSQGTLELAISFFVDEFIKKLGDQDQKKLRSCIKDVEHPTHYLILALEALDDLLGLVTPRLKQKLDRCPDEAIRQSLIKFINSPLEKKISIPNYDDQTYNLEILKEEPFVSRLESLTISEAVHLSSLPEAIRSLKSLQLLIVFKNRGLCALPEWLGELPRLRSVNAQFCNLRDLPRSLLNLENLTLICLEGNPKLDLSQSSNLALFPPKKLDIIVNEKESTLTASEKEKLLSEARSRIAAIQQLTQAGADRADRQALDLAPNFQLNAQLQHFDLDALIKEYVKRRPESFYNEELYSWAEIPDNHVQEFQTILDIYTKDPSSPHHEKVLFILRSLAAYFNDQRSCVKQGSDKEVLLKKKLATAINHMRLKRNKDIDYMLGKLETLTLYILAEEYTPVNASLQETIFYLCSRMLYQYRSAIMKEIVQKQNPGYGFIPALTRKVAQFAAQEIGQKGQFLELGSFFTSPDLVKRAAIALEAFRKEYNPELFLLSHLTTFIAENEALLSAILDFAEEDPILKEFEEAICYGKGHSLTVTGIAFLLQELNILTQTPP